MTMVPTRVSTPLGYVIIPAGYDPFVMNRGGGQDARAFAVISDAFLVAGPAADRFGAVFAGVNDKTLTDFPRVQQTKSPIDQRKKELQSEMDAWVRDKARLRDYIPAVVHHGRIVVETEALCRLVEEGKQYKKPALSAYEKCREFAFKRLSGQWMDALTEYNASVIRNAAVVDVQRHDGRKTIVSHVGTKPERGIRMRIDVHMMAAFAACSMNLANMNPHPAELYWHMMTLKHLIAGVPRPSDAYNGDEISEIIAMLYAAHVIHMVKQGNYGEHIRYLFVFANEDANPIRSEMRMLTRLSGHNYVGIYKDREGMTAANIALIKAINEKTKKRTET